MTVMQRKNSTRVLLDSPTNIIINSEAELEIGLGFSNLVRADLGLTLIKTSGIFWVGYEACK